MSSSPSILSFPFYPCNRNQSLIVHSKKGGRGDGGGMCGVQRCVVHLLLSGSVLSPPRSMSCVQRMEPCLTGTLGT